MRGGDPRGRRLAIVGDDLMNAHLGGETQAADALAALEASGFGLMALPPAPLAAKAAEHLVDQLEDYLRHGYAAVLIESRGAGAALALVEAHCHARGIAPPARIRADADFQQALAAISSPAG